MATAPASVHRALGSHGRPLAPGARHALEQRFGRSLGEVRIHSDRQAADSAREIGARGYSYGNEVVLDPAIGSDRLGQVLMHELVHVAQVADEPRPAVREVPMSLDPHDPLEREARAAAHAPAVSRRGPAILRRDDKDAPTSNPQTGPPVLEISEELLVWHWLSRWEVETQERTLLMNRLGPDHAANVHKVARELWLRRLANREGRADPAILLGGEAAETDEMRSLRDGPVKALYERAVYIQELQLTQREQDEVETEVAAFGLKGKGPASALTGDPRGDTTTLTRNILCRRVAFIVHAPLDPLFCIDDASTEANPLFQAFRATVIAPLYTELRRRPGQALITAMKEGRMGGGTAIAGQVRQIGETGAVKIRGSTVVPTLGLLKMLDAFAATSTQRTHGDADFEVASIARETAGPHGTPTAGGFQVGRAVDITRFAGHRIHIDSPADAVAGIAAAMRALPPGCYIFGLPRPPREDPVGGVEDLKTYPYFYVGSPMPGTKPPLSPKGTAAIHDNPFLPAVDLRKCPTGNLDGDLAKLLPGGQADLTAAAHEARARGAKILCLFPDGADHLHVQVEACK
jgi:hypothetical protein